MSKTEEELFEDFLKEYEIEDDFYKEYFKDSVAFDSYQLRYYTKEIVKALIPIEKILEVIESAIEKIKGVRKWDYTNT